MQCFKNVNQDGSLPNKCGSPTTISKLIALVIATLNLKNQIKKRLLILVNFFTTLNLKKYHLCMYMKNILKSVKIVDDV